MATLTRNTDLDSDIGKAFEVDGDLRLDQFAHELAQAENWRKRSDLILTSTGTVPVLYVLRPDATVQTVIDSAAAHSPDEDWTDPDAPAPVAEVTLADVLAKVQSGDALTGAEIQAAVRELVLDWDARQQTG